MFHVLRTRVWVPFLVIALLGNACGAAATSGDAACPDVRLEQIAAPGVKPAAAPAVYGFLIDRAYAGNSRRSASYPWPLLPTNALRTISELLPKLELQPGDAVFGSWISHNSNDTHEIFLPLTQVTAPAMAAAPVAPVAPVPPVNKLECNDYGVKARAYNERAKAWQADLGRWQESSKAAQQNASAAVVGSLQASLAKITPTPDTLGTDIYGGLAVAAGVFNVNPANRKLVLFSDMTDTVGSAVRPSLEQTDVVIALYHRDDANDQGEGQKVWEGEFMKLKSRAPLFLPWAATTSDKIAQILRTPSR